MLTDSQTGGLLAGRVSSARSCVFLFLQRGRKGSISHEHQGRYKRGWTGWSGLISEEKGGKKHTCWVLMTPTEIGEGATEAYGRSGWNRQIQYGGPVGCARMSSGLAYRAPGPAEVQVDSLARLVEMSLHILFPKTQECVHADVQATLRLLQDKRQGREPRQDEAVPGETKTWSQKLLASGRKVCPQTPCGFWRVT